MGKDKPIQPGINCDGWYAYCPNCYHFDLEPTEKITRCPKCNQAIDWSWFSDFKDKTDE